MKKVGLTLKEAREKQGLSLDQASQLTKIHIQKLQAIEEGDYSKLPAKVFLKGLIRSYARVLKVDEKKVQQLCDGEMEKGSSEDFEATSNTTVVDEEDLEKRPVGRFQAPNSFFIIVGVVVAFVLCAFIYITVSKINSYSKEEAINLDKTLPEEESPVEQEETPLTNEKTTEVVSKKIEEKSEKKEKTIVKPTQENPAPPQSLQKKEIQKKPTEEVKKTEPKPEIKEGVPAAIKKPTRIYSDNKLVIKAVSETKIEITWSDGHIQPIELKKDEQKTFIFSNPLKVKYIDASKVNVIFNSKFLGAPGSNEEAEVKYP